MSAEKPSEIKPSKAILANKGKQERSGINSKSVREMSENSDTLKPEKGRRIIGKTDTRYWLQPGKLHSDPRWNGALFCKVQVNCRRESFPLRTNNQQTAAGRAAKIYGDVVALGWEAALEKHKPDSLKAAKVATVGDVIEAATRLSSARRESLETYAKALRRITSAVIGLENDRKFDCKRGSKEWRAKVDSVSLSDLTPVRVKSWKNAFMKAAKTPEERNHAIITINSLIRNSKALLSKKVLPFLSKEIQLPAELWFAGITKEKEPSLRYKSKVDAAALMATAREHLAESEPEAFKLLLLTLICGLRRSEADALLWSQFDFEKGILTMEDTEHKRLKSQDSAGEIGLDTELIAMLRGYKARSKSEFVLETPKLSWVPLAKLKNRGYRCEATHRVLLDWLRKNGVPELRPMHTMRKEIGSIIATRDGIFKASRYLRHSDINITAKLYADPKAPVSAGLGSLLTARPANVVKAEFKAATTASKSKRKARQA